MKFNLNIKIYHANSFHFHYYENLIFEPRLIISKDLFKLGRKTMNYLLNDDLIERNQTPCGCKLVCGNNNNNNNIIYMKS